MEKLPPLRRVVTEIGADGKSCIAQVFPAPKTLTNNDRPGYASTNIWATAGTPASIREFDASADVQGVMPPREGTVIRVIDYPPRPDDPDEARRQAQSTFRSLFTDAGHQPDALRHPGMHITDTVDYAIVLRGEIIAVMDEGEEILREGDILIQRGTNHAWENRSKEMARMAFVLIDASGSR